LGAIARNQSSSQSGTQRQTIMIPNDVRNGTARLVIKSLIIGTYMETTRVDADELTTTGNAINKPGLRLRLGPGQLRMQTGFVTMAQEHVG